jgi:selenophosphate synthase
MEYPASNRLQDIVAMAKDAIMIVKIQNIPDDLLHCDRAIISRTGVYDWRSDQ